MIQHKPETKAGWSREFDEPILLPDGRTLVTLRDAAAHITALPKKEASLPEWQSAIDALMLVVELGGPTMFACIGVMRAVNHGYVPEFTESKGHHWGRRKLKRTNEDLLLHDVGRSDRVRHCGHDFPGDDTADFSGLGA